MPYGISVFLFLALSGLFFSLDRLSRRVSTLEMRLQRLLRHVGFDADRIPAASAEVIALARTPGAQIAAIKAYRQQTGASLREAKAEIERLTQLDPTQTC